MNNIKKDFLDLAKTRLFTADRAENYIGERLEKNRYAEVYTRYRDSRLLERHNWAVITEDILEDYIDGETLHIIRHRCWASGWIEWVLVDTQKASEKLMAAITELWRDLDAYPLLNEDQYCEKEWDFASNWWNEFYDNEERIELLRKNPDHDATSFYDLLLMAKGVMMPSGSIYQELICDI